MAAVLLGKTIHRRRKVTGETGNENSARLARGRRARQSGAQTDERGTRQIEMVGAKYVDNGAYCPEAQDQRGRATGELTSRRGAKV
jgi:hypothetical protein